jgi:Domain of unknown function (DUF4917)
MGVQPVADPKVQVMTFSQALESAGGGKKHLVLGNGFSRACRDDIFAYSALFDGANFDALSPAAREAFNALKTKDFEVVIRMLRSASTLVKVYDAANHDLVARFASDAVGLREVLVHAIAGNHPDRPNAIEPHRYAACRKFLLGFDHVFTLNYDLLLYWALMQNELQPAVRFDDGFRTPDEGPTEYVTWEVENTNPQKLFYLHGALHVFDSGPEIQKYTWVNTGVPLIDQIRGAMDEGKFPVFVAEGESAAKVERIKHSAFLIRGLRSLSQITGSLFVYGHSMDPSDEHILRMIGKNKVSRLIVGLHAADSASRTRIITRARQLAEARPVTRPLEVSFFDANSAAVWG